MVTRRTSGEAGQVAEVLRASEGSARTTRRGGIDSRGKGQGVLVGGSHAKCRGAKAPQESKNERGGDGVWKGLKGYSKGL